MVASFLGPKAGFCSGSPGAEVSGLGKEWFGGGGVGGTTPLNRGRLFFQSVALGPPWESYKKAPCKGSKELYSGGGTTEWSARPVSLRDFPCGGPFRAIGLDRRETRAGPAKRKR